MSHLQQEFDGRQLKTQCLFTTHTQESTVVKAIQSYLHTALKQIGFFGPKAEPKEKDEIDQWIGENQETCLFCAEPLRMKTFKDSVKGHCHLMGTRRMLHEAVN